MRILLLSSLPPPSGGIATWTVGYKRYCESNGIQLVIVNNALNGSRKEQNTAKRSVLDEIGRTSRIIYDLIRKTLKEKPDVIHLNSSCSRFGIYRDCICAMIGKFFSIPVVLQCHCNIQDQVHGRMAEFALRTMASISRKVLVLNRFSAEYARRFAEDRVLVVPNFADGKDVFERSCVADKIRTVIFVGHVCKAKGVEEIFEAAAQCSDIRFVLAGPVQKEMAELPHGSNVKLLGPQPHETVLQLLREADVFLFPSYTEGFANALLEAMAAGLPVIATDVGANAEMIENEGGIIIPVKDANSIVDAVKQLQDDSERRLVMGKRNIQRVKDKYLLGAIMKRLMDVYFSCC